MYAWMLAAVLICGANVFILYTDKDDDSAPTQPSQGENKTVSELKEEMMALKWVPQKESILKIVDWERIYPLTKYYVL